MYEKSKVECYKILILEDDLEAVGILLQKLHILESHFAPKDFDVSVFSTYEAVEEIVNTRPAHAYDAILLDRDCKLGGSFHVLDIERFGPEKVISISSTPTWNEEARQRGVTRVVGKSFSDLGGFAEKVAEELKEVLLSQDKST